MKAESGKRKSRERGAEKGRDRGRKWQTRRQGDKEYGRERNKTVAVIVTG